MWGNPWVALFMQMNIGEAWDSNSLSNLLIKLSSRELRNIGASSGDNTWFNLLISLSLGELNQWLFKYSLATFMVYRLLKYALSQGVDAWVLLAIQWSYA